MTDIPINPVTRRVQFAGTTGTGPFAFNFNILQATDIAVLKNNVVLSIGTGSTNYSVSIASNGTGSVSLVTALISSDTLVIMGGRELSRTTDFVTAGDLLASSLNEQLDSNVVMSQQIDEKVSRSISTQPGDPLRNVTLPIVADRANELIKFDASGNVTTVPVSEVAGSDIDTQKITFKTSAGATKLVINANINDLITAAGALNIISTSGDIDFKPGGGQINLLGTSGQQRIAFDNAAQATMQYFQNSNVTKLGVVDPTAARTLLLPNASDTLVGKATTDTLTNKTIVNAAFTGNLNFSGDVAIDASGDITLDADGGEIFFKDGGALRLTFQVSAVAATLNSTSDFNVNSAGDIGLKPAGGQVDILGTSGQQRIQFNNPSSPTMIYYQNSNTTTLGVVNPTATRTILFPNASDTLVGKATTDILTNKTLNSPTITGGLNMSDVNITNVGTISLDRIASDSGAGINLDSSNVIVIDSSNGQTIFKQNGSTRLTFTTGSSGLQTLTTAGIFSLTATTDINLRPNGGQLYILRNNGGDNFQFNTSASPTLGIHQNSNVTNLGLVDPTATRNILFPNASDTLVGKATTDTLTNKTITSPVLNTGVSGSAFLDEDNFASNSATKIASQQSIKAYVDAATAGGGAGSLSTVLGIGNTTGSNNVLFGDNNKAIFGAGSDLQIYHDGSNSYIKDAGTGNLNLQGENLALENTSGDNYVIGVNGSFVKLYYSGSEKLATTNTGINITGTLTSDGFTVDGNARIEELGAIAKLTLERGGSANNADSAAVDLLETNAGNEGANFADAATNGFRLKLDGSANDFLIQSGAGTTVRTRFGIDRDTGDISFYEDTGSTPKLFWDASAESLGIGTASPARTLSIESTGNRIATLKHTDGTLAFITFSDTNTSDDGQVRIGALTNDLLAFAGGAERLRITAAGNLLVGTTATGSGALGFRYRADLKAISAVADGQIAAYFGRRSSDGEILRFRKDDANVGSIGACSGQSDIYIGSGNVGLRFADSVDQIFAYRPDTNATTDNTLDWGRANVRWTDIFATNGTIQTSDRNEKQDIAALTSAEMLVAKRISALFKTFRWKDRVAANANARIHTGIIAQDVQAAFEAESLDAGRYAMFMSDTWWEHDVEVAAVEADDTVEPAIEAADAYTRTDTYDTEDEAPSGSTKKTRLGIRYPELLSFLAAYNEQRFAAIETRLTALEG